jgi:hypothetical protein
MGAALTLSISVISSLLPLIRQGTDAWRAISEARDAIKAAQDANRDLSTEEFLDLMTRCRNAGNELQTLAATAETELLAAGKAP